MPKFSSSGVFASGRQTCRIERQSVLVDEESVGGREFQTLISKQMEGVLRGIWLAFADCGHRRSAAGTRVRLRPEVAIWAWDWPVGRI